MPLKMKQLPQSERPYEKLLMYGPKKLSNAELLAIIIKTGKQSFTTFREHKWACICRNRRIGKDKRNR